MQTSLLKQFFSVKNLAILGFWIGLTLAFRSSVMTPYFVPTASMAPTIQAGDRVLAIRFAYNLRLPFTETVLFPQDPVARGDVIVFQSPENPSIDCIKRVIGLPGDRIAFHKGRPLINGQAAPVGQLETIKKAPDQSRSSEKLQVSDSHKLSHRDHSDLEEERYRMMAGPKTAGGRIQEFIVPENSVYVLGDNRSVSKDSRHWGEVPYSYIKGRVSRILWSTEQGAGHFLPRLRADRVGKTIL